MVNELFLHHFGFLPPKLCMFRCLSSENSPSLHADDAVTSRNAFWNDGEDTAGAKLEKDGLGDRDNFS